MKLARNRNGLTALLVALVLVLLASASGSASGLRADTTATPADLEVDLELVLAVDISLSMDSAEQKLQRDGYVAAFRHPEVINAIVSGALRRIAVVYVEWAGSGTQDIKVPWTVIDSQATSLAFADQLAAAPISRRRRTSISGVIGFAAGLFSTNEHTGLRRVIDVSGDGPNNMGDPVTMARDKAIAEGIVINGLPITLQTGSLSGFFDLADLDKYYEDCVIGGTGAFIVPVTQSSEFIPAIRRKLLLEIADRQPAPPPRLFRAQFQLSPQSTPRIDCMIGEKLWQRWMLRQDWE